MSECTKGKLEAIGNTIYRKQTYIGACVGYFQKTILGDDVDKANAKEIVRRWNAFEEGGIVEELRTALEKIADQAQRAALVQDRSVGIIKQTCGVIFKEAEAALAKI